MLWERGRLRKKAMPGITSWITGKSLLVQETMSDMYE